MENKLAHIAKKILRMDTLQARNSDALDYTDVSVWSVNAALEAAYAEGYAAALDAAAYAAGYATAAAIRGDTRGNSTL